MNNRLDPTKSGRLSPEKMLAVLRARDIAAFEFSTRFETRAEKSTRDPARKRYLIGLITGLLPILDLSHPVFEKILLGVRSHLSANECDVLLCATLRIGTDVRLRRAAAVQAIERGVDGIIARGVAYGDPECEPILNSGLPVIFVDNDVIAEHAGSVMSSNVDAMAGVVNHLYESGRRRIAHISGH